jgi:hypothetical protein
MANLCGYRQCNGAENGATIGSGFASAFREEVDGLMMPLVHPGELITCPEGHVVAEVLALVPGLDEPGSVRAGLWRRGCCVNWQVRLRRAVLAPGRLAREQSRLAESPRADRKGRPHEWPSLSLKRY